MSRSLRLILLGATLLICVLVLAYSSWRRHELQTRVSAARKHLEAGNAPMALRTLQPLLGSGRQDGELFLVAARALRMEGATSSALQLLDKCVGLGYETDETDVERGIVLATMGRFVDAESALMSSTSKEAASILAKLHLQMLEREKALRDLERCKTLDPTDAEPWFLTGTVWAEVSEHDRAVAEFKKALELKHDLYDARLQLALSLIELGQIDEASERLRECLAARPSDLLPALRLAMCQIEQGSVADARTALGTLIADGAYGTDALVELGKIELQEDNAELAEQLLGEAMRRQPVNDAALYNRALALQRLGKSDEAAALMKQARTIQDVRRQLADAMDRINANPLDNEARCDAAQLWMQLGDKQRAADLFAGVLARDPANQRALLGLKQLN